MHAYVLNSSFLQFLCVDYRKFSEGGATARLQGVCIVHKTLWMWFVIFLVKKNCRYAHSKKHILLSINY